MKMKRLREVIRDEDGEDGKEKDTQTYGTDFLITTADLVLVEG